MNGKTIRIFLADGEPTGTLLAEISSWTGKVLVAPRCRRGQLSKREEVRRAGVYLLVGPDPDDPSRALAYIGEGDNVFRRLLRHNRNKESTGWSCWETGGISVTPCLRTSPALRRMMRGSQFEPAVLRLAGACGQLTPGSCGWSASGSQISNPVSSAYLKRRSS